LIVPVLVSAEVSRVEVALRHDVAGGRSFGSSGPCERITGKLYFLVDPANRRNQVIADWQLLVSGEHQNERLRVIIS
jgi:hypothetical protein